MLFFSFLTIKQFFHDMNIVGFFCFFFFFRYFRHELCVSFLLLKFLFLTFEELDIYSFVLVAWMMHVSFTHTIFLHPFWGNTFLYSSWYLSNCVHSSAFLCLIFKNHQTLGGGSFVFYTKLQKNRNNRVSLLLGFQVTELSQQPSSVTDNFWQTRQGRPSLIHKNRQGHPPPHTHTRC